MKALPRHIHTLPLLHFHLCSCLSCRDCLAPAILMGLISAAAATWQAWRASRAALPLPRRCVTSHALPAVVAWSARPPPPPLSPCPLRRMRVARARSSLPLSRLHRCPFTPSYAPQAAAASDGGDVAGMVGEQGGAAVAAQVRRLPCCRSGTPSRAPSLLAASLCSHFQASSHTLQPQKSFSTQDEFQAYLAELVSVGAEAVWVQRRAVRRCPPLPGASPEPCRSGCTELRGCGGGCTASSQGLW